MQHEILYRPSYSLLKVDLTRGESICAESGAMVSMSGGVEIQTAARGGLCRPFRVRNGRGIAALTAPCARHWRCSSRPAP